MLGSHRPSSPGSSTPLPQNVEELLAEEETLLTDKEALSEEEILDVELLELREPEVGNEDEDEKG